MRAVRACILGLGVLAGSAFAQKPSLQELGALSHLQSAFSTRADAGVMAPAVALGPELERRFGMPSGTNGARVYRAVLALMGEGAIAVRPATQQQASSAGSPVFVLAGAGGTQLLVQYELRDSRISYVGQLGSAEPPAPPPVAKPQPKPQTEVVRPATVPAAAKPMPGKPRAWTVQFDYKSASLSPKARAQLDADLAPGLAAAAGRRFQLSAYTDSIGSAKYNQALSRVRAEAVRGYLVEKGVRAEEIEVVVLGDAAPVKSCAGLKSEKAKRDCGAPNRRVVIEAR